MQIKQGGKTTTIKTEQDYHHYYYHHWEQIIIKATKDNIIDLMLIHKQVQWRPVLQSQASPLGM